MNNKQWDPLLCLECEHFGNREYGTCKAFPDRIPHAILSGEVGHFTKLEGQPNDFVYEKKEEK